MLRTIMAVAVGLFLGWSNAGANAATPAAVEVDDLEHGGGLNACGCHFNRKSGACHCHHDYGCGCACQPARCG